MFLLIKHRLKRHLLHALYLFPTFHEAVGYSSCFYDESQLAEILTYHSVLFCHMQLDQELYWTLALTLSPVRAAWKRQINKQTDILKINIWI